MAAVPAPGRYVLVTGRHVANILGVNQSRTRQLAYKGRLQCVRHRDRTLRYRRDQLVVIANARGAKPASGVGVW